MLYCAGAIRPAQISSVAAFVLRFLVIISMYGGGFATVPAYLKDMFGTRYVGAIHGWLITAWSMAGIFGPVLVNYIRQYQYRPTACRRRRPTTSPCTSWPDCSSSASIANLFIKAVHERFHMQTDDYRALPRLPKPAGRRRLALTGKPAAPKENSK